MDYTKSIIKGRKLRIAVVGCGRISKKHFMALRDHAEDLSLVAACDVDDDAFSEEIIKERVQRYNSLEKLLVNEKVDLVVLCTPSGEHAAQAKLVAKYNVSVVTEKPMATKYSDGLEMLNAFEKSSGRLFVVKQNRFNPTVKLLKKAIDDGRFGQIKLYHSNVFWTRPQSYYDQGSGWRGTWEMDGGALMNQCSHYVDLLQWLCGPIQDVHCMHSTSRKIQVEDTAIVNLRSRTAALGSIAVTMLTYPQNLEGSITILGETGSVKLSGTALNKIDIWEFGDSKSYDKEILDVNYTTNDVYGNGHTIYYKHVIDVMRGVRAATIDGKEGIKSLELLAAMYISARDQRVVSLPLNL
ncbi:Gfo/Idh/MocA family oxidoreductase [Amylibacter sp.]|nr:Gfo/Idh/MocA family oxidoreductase [Amylibacter sp.]MDB4095657.1 Gfo/Idh/MocA family oxidoreductase [Amylibacter sp.]